jgi:hypothetical protein
VAILDDIEDTVEKIQSEFDKGLSNPPATVPKRFREYVESAIELLQELYNLVELALNLLENHPDENSEFISGLKSSLLGSDHNYKPYFAVEYGAASSYPYNYTWKFTRKFNPIEGIKVVIYFLSQALGFDVDSSSFVSRIVSASESFRMVRGAIARLKSRLGWMVMYPDSLSKDSNQIRTILLKNNLTMVWEEFSAGIDNFRKGDLLDSTNRFSNSIVELIRSIAESLGFKSGGFGTKALFLERIGLIHTYAREMISSFYGYLSKFRKGQEPSYKEARFLLDLAFTIHGHLVEAMETYQPNNDEIEKVTKDLKKRKKKTKKQSK